MTTATKVPTRAQELLAARSTNQLLNDFIVTGFSHDPTMTIVRGRIMDELERRNHAAFDAWLDQDIPTDESIKLFF